MTGYQETTTQVPGKYDVDFRGHLATVKSEDNPMEEPPGGTERSLENVQTLPGRAAGGRKMEGKYNGGED